MKILQFLANFPEWFFAKIFNLREMIYQHRNLTITFLILLGLVIFLGFREVYRDFKRIDRAIKKAEEEIDKEE